MFAIIGLVLSIFASILPTAIYVTMLWSLDRYEKEPLHLLALAFAWGAVPAAVASIVFELAFDVSLQHLSAPAAEVLSASTLTPVVEEVLKALMLVAILATHRAQFDDVLDGIVYGGLVGFGFAMSENIMYFFGSWRAGGAAEWGVVVFVRAFLFGLNHAFYTGIAGAGLGYARLARSAWSRRLAPPLALLLAIGFHAAHNLMATLATAQPLALIGSALSDWGGVLMVLAIVRQAWHDEQSWLMSELTDETTTGVISAADYECLTSRRRRLRSQLDALSRGGWAGLRVQRRTYQLAARLAFKKHQVRTLGEETGLAGEIAALRAELAGLDS